MNVVMESGKKAVAERIIYGALEQVEKKAGKDPLEGLHDRVEQREADGRSEVPPRGRCELPSSRGSSPVRRMALAMRWLKESARKRGEKSMAAAPGQRTARGLRRSRRRDEEARRVHRMAEANKAFSHFRF
jgi:small subunit ribosomal protein S7